MLQKMCGNCIYFSPNHKEHMKCKACYKESARVNFVPRNIKCPVPSCGAGMIYYKTDAYLECPECGTQIWPFVMEKSDKDTIRQEFEKTLPCDRSKELTQGTLVTVHSKVKGGSKSSKGSKKDQLMAKKSTTQLYKELAADGKIVIKGNRHDVILQK